MSTDNTDSPSAPSPEYQAAIAAERATVRPLDLDDLLVIEKTRFWLERLLKMTKRRGWHHQRSQCRSLNQRAHGLLDVLTKFENNTPNED